MDCHIKRENSVFLETNLCGGNFLLKMKTETFQSVKSVVSRKRKPISLTNNCAKFQPSFQLFWFVAIFHEEDKIFSAAIRWNTGIPKTVVEKIWLFWN